MSGFAAGRNGSTTHWRPPRAPFGRIATPAAAEDRQHCPHAAAGTVSTPWSVTDYWFWPGEGEGRGWWKEGVSLWRCCCCWLSAAAAVLIYNCQHAMALWNGVGFGGLGTELLEGVSAVARPPPWPHLAEQNPHGETCIVSCRDVTASNHIAVQSKDFLTVFDSWKLVAKCVLDIVRTNLPFFQERDNPHTAYLGMQNKNNNWPFHVGPISMQT